MKLKDSLWMICVIVFLLLSLTSNASASSMFESGSLVVINETVEDDVYIAGDTLIVNGMSLGMSWLPEVLCRSTGTFPGISLLLQVM